MDTTNWYVISNVTITLNAQLAASSISCERSLLLERPHSASPWNPPVSWWAGDWWNSSACGAAAVTDSWTYDRKLKDTEEKIFLQVYVFEAPVPRRSRLFCPFRYILCNCRGGNHMKSNLAFCHAFDIFCLFLELGEQEIGIYTDMLTRLKMS